MTTQPESLEFKAEVQQLLHILSHSLYTEREIFLRELISNASDALNRVQFEMLTNHELLDPEVELAVRIDFDEEAKTLTVSDTGIGMTHDELIENLGTIAHSGAMAFLKKLEAERDEAREHVIVKRIVDVHRRESFCRYRGAYLPVEFINRIRLGEMTIEQAIEERGKRWPVCTYGDKNGLSLEQAYREAV